MEACCIKHNGSSETVAIGLSFHSTAYPPMINLVRANTDNSFTTRGLLQRQLTRSKLYSHHILSIIFISLICLMLSHDRIYRIAVCLRVSGSATRLIGNLASSHSFDGMPLVISDGKLHHVDSAGHQCNFRANYFRLAASLTLILFRVRLHPAACKLSTSQAETVIVFSVILIFFY